VRKYGQSASSTVLFAYDRQGHLGEYDNTGAALKEYVWLGDEPVAMFMPNGANPPSIFYFHSDHINTPRVVVDRSNNLRWRWMSEPFGTTAAETNPSGLGALTFNLRMPGQYFDSETGLFYNWHRDYDPGGGRYVQSDPIGLQGGINTYAYVGGNPLTFVDPNGLWGTTVDTYCRQRPAECPVILPPRPLPPTTIPPSTAEPLLEPAATNQLSFPDRPRTRGVVRCNWNTQAGGPSGTSAEAEGEGTSWGDAQRDAEEKAKKKLGCQAEHCQCACVDSKGDRRRTGGR
jgi:RHS repeat-associated protein